MRLLCLTVAVLVPMAAFAADEKKAEKKEAPPKLAGKYDCVGGDDDSKYEGTVEISEEGAGYKVEWVIGDSTFSGMGIWENDRLCVSWKLDGACQSAFGVIVYSRDKDGSGQDDVVDRDPVGRDQNKVVAVGVEVTDLSRVQQLHVLPFAGT